MRGEGQWHGRLVFFRDCMCVQAIALPLDVPLHAEFRIFSSWYGDLDIAIGHGCHGVQLDMSSCRRGRACILYWVGCSCIASMQYKFGAVKVFVMCTIDQGAGRVETTQAMLVGKRQCTATPSQGWMETASQLPLRFKAPRRYHCQWHVDRDRPGGDGQVFRHPSSP